MLKILQFFIIVFVCMAVVGLARGKGRTKANGTEMQREDRKILSFKAMADKYEKDPENSGMTEDDYIYACFMTDREYKGYNLKRAVSFQTTCEMRHLNDAESRRNLLKYDELFGEVDADAFDVDAFYELGERVSAIADGRKRIEKAQ